MVVTLLIFGTKEFESIENVWYKGIEKRTKTLGKQGFDLKKVWKPMYSIISGSKSNLFLCYTGFGPSNIVIAPYPIRNSNSSVSMFPGQLSYSK